MSLILRKGEVGAVGTTNDAALGYCLVKWLSKPFTLQTDTAGMSGMIPAGTIVANALYFKRVQLTPHWYTPSGVTTVLKDKYAMQTGLQLQPISTTNALPLACARAGATRKTAVKVSSLDHEAIMEEASKCDRLEYDRNNDDDDKSKEESNEENKENGSKLESE